MNFRQKISSVWLVCAAVFSTCLPQAFAGQTEPASANSPTVASEMPRPNVLVIMADDLGFADLGCYGSEIETPHLDALAAGGLRFTQFYNTAKCHSSRVSLLTGLYCDQAGGASLKRGATFADVLGQAGYQTAMVGKWHLSGQPTDFGFQRYWGHLSGATNFFTGDKSFRLNGQPWEVPAELNGKPFYTTHANGDFAIDFIDESLDEQEPFLLYMAFNAPHYPLQAPREAVEKYDGRYDQGWDVLREQRHARQLEMGLLPASWSLSPRPEHIPAWESLSEEERQWEADRMEVFAAMVDLLDQNVGRVVSHLRETGQLDNTLILFCSDNGACPFERTRGRGLEPWDPESYWTYDAAWGNVGNTPFRLYKQNQHEGGISSPLIVHWPHGLKTQPGSYYREPSHLIDVMATLIDVAGAEYPKRVGQREIDPLQGRTLVPAFRGETGQGHDELYFHFGTDRALRQGDWKLVSAKRGRWELYNLAEDRTELHDLSAEHPERVAEMAARWFVLAEDVDRLKGRQLAPVKDSLTPLEFRKDTSGQLNARSEASDGAAGAKGKRQRDRESDVSSADGDIGDVERGRTLVRGELAEAAAVSAAGNAKKSRPNIVLIMSDDMGFSDIGCYGGEIRTPNLDALAAGGLRYTQFYNTGRCCPTRASLLTGLYPHQAGIGHMMEDRGEAFPGYRGDLNTQCRTIAEVLRPSGYDTYAVGKWHVTPHIRPGQPQHNWPLGRGFDRFYGIVSGAASFFDPHSLARDQQLISAFADPEYEPETYYFTDAISDHAVRYIDDHMDEEEERPFFMYVAYTAAHWPMHALPEDIEKYRGKYDAGYQAIREARFRRAVEMGLIDANQPMAPLRDDWDAVEHPAWEAACMEVYAAMVDRMDQGIGRIVERLRVHGELDNTLIFFLQDNGGCAENYGRNPGPKKPQGPRLSQPTLEPMAADALQLRMEPTQTRDGYPVRMGPEAMPGPADTYIGYGRGWATVSNTPFREYKHWVHEGGIATPLIVHWPNEIEAAGELRREPGHLIDIMATCVDVADAKYPQEATPLEGLSLRPSFAGEALKRDALYWEHEGNRAVRKGPWKAVAKGAGGDWELYDMRRDRVEAENLADKHPERLRALVEQWEAYARRAQVLPWIWKQPYQGLEPSTSEKSR